jgi:hypothetical protein
MPLEVMSVSFKDSPAFPPAERIILPPMFPNTPVDFKTFDFALPAGFAWADTMTPYLKLNYKVLGTAELRHMSIYPWAHDFGNFDNDLFRHDPNVAQFAFLRVVDSTRKIIIQPGEWKLEKTLIIPSGYKVVCGEGTRLDLTNSANIISYSPLDWRGSEASPIVISSKDSTGEGVLVLQTPAPSTLEYVSFDNLSSPAQDGWALTGAVTFYEAEARLSNCQFTGNRCEDALNFFRVKFSLDRVLFKNTKSDAFDADFGNGRITNSSFVNCGNDAIDVSGSVAELENIFIDGTADKGVSSGENSRVTARNLDIRNSEIALTSKDQSELVIDNVKLAACSAGFAVYVKKPEFGPASLAAQNVEMSECRAPYLIEHNSSMKLNGKIMASNYEKVENMLYGVEFGKASKPARP